MELALVSMSDLLAPLAFQVGAGGIAGFIVGYALKKLARLVAVIAGIFFVVLLYLSYIGIININYDKLIEALKGLTGQAGGAAGLVTPIVANLPFAATFMAGLGLGLKMG
ncbi:MAG: FUN14 domain-containing protein [Candidatus Bathyarchaeia archaeon]